MAKPLKVAIVHDWLIGGGAERVVEALHEIYPDAPIYTSYCTDEWRARLDNKVITGFLQHGPFPRLRKYIAVLRMWWFSRLDLSSYDLVISSSGNGEAFGVRVPNGTHVCYCHTPTHYYWRHAAAYLRRPGFGIFDPLVRFVLPLIISPLRRWDYRAAQRVDYFIANSTHIQNDIKQYYGRDSVVIHPPVAVDRFAKEATAHTRNGFVTAGRLVPAKHTDIIVEACTRLGVPLTVIGKGPEYDKLKRIAGPTVAIAGYVPDDEIPAHMARAKAFIFASYDDFGITPIEALAAGTPVIAYRAGGALDYIIEDKTGVFFNKQTADAIADAIEQFSHKKLTHNDTQQVAKSFSPRIFKQKMQQFIDTLS